MNIRVTSNGLTTRVVTDEGDDISDQVSEVVWRHGHSGHATAEVKLRVLPLDAYGEVTRWHGLEDVPASVLRDELERRDV